MDEETSINSSDESSGGIGWTKQEYLDVLLELLKGKQYEDVHTLILEGSKKEVREIYSDLLPIVIKKFDKYHAGKQGYIDQLNDLVLLLNSYVEADESFTVLIKAVEKIKMLPTLCIVGNILLKMIPEYFRCFPTSKQVPCHYLKFWVRTLKCSVRVYHDTFREGATVPYIYETLEEEFKTTDGIKLKNEGDKFTECLKLFSDIFRESKSDSYDLLDVLCVHVIPCIPFEKHTLEKQLSAIDDLYAQSENHRRPNNVLRVLCFKHSKVSIAEVWSPFFRLQYCLQPMISTLDSSSSNIFAVSYVVLVLKRCIATVEHGSISRDELPIFMPFIFKFIPLCEKTVLDVIRSKCMDLFKQLMERFEDIAQVLTLRAIFESIEARTIRLEYEPLVLAWLIDLYRAKLMSKSIASFRTELGSIWCVLVRFKYTELAGATQFLISMLMLAKQQALLNEQPKLLLMVRKRFLQPLLIHISDLSNLITQNDLCKKAPANPADMQSALMKTNKKVLPFLQFSVREANLIVLRCLEKADLI